jgi:DNA-binding response OmpR family regulator
MQKRILVIDDDPTLIKVVQPFLESQGFKVSIALNGQKGMDLIKEEPPDLIILDIQMPIMNGYTFVLELGKILDIKRIPIIVLTIKEGMAEIFKVEDVKEYIVKPIKLTELLTAIRKYV